MQAHALKMPRVPPIYDVHRIGSNRDRRRVGPSTGVAPVRPKGQPKVLNSII